MKRETQQGGATLAIIIIIVILLAGGYYVWKMTEQRARENKAANDRAAAEQNDWQNLVPETNTATVLQSQ